ncbi:class I SAM-dependent methyltransferase [Mesorhizobium sp. SB112]|uniref:class I SAM-dependent methyltransferase n=1 Tax=Mesorhizobium sp. SB112 TaxID=3151853 RepID=UPI003263ABAE
MAVSVVSQQQFWNDWNASTREQHLDEVSFRQAEVVKNWLTTIGRKDLDILEVGCGSCWFCEELSQFGRVTGTDLSNEVLDRAQKRMPHVELVAGDFMDLDFGRDRYDLIVSLEVLSHVEDQPAFMAKLARHLRPGGYLMLATQNRPILQNLNRLPPPGPGQLRHWVDKKELTTLLSRQFDVKELFSVTPRANKGIMRIINSRTFNQPIRALVGNRFDRMKEAMGLGWTLMALSRKKR